MPKSQRAGFVYAICAYSFDGTEPTGNPAWLPTFIAIKDRLDMGAKASERGRAMAKARWGKRKHDAESDAGDDAGDAAARGDPDAQAYAPAYAQASTDADAQAHAQAYAQASDVGDAEVEDEVEDEKEKHIAHLASDVIACLNEEAGTGYRPTTPKTRRLIAARVAEGFGLDDFRTVIAKKCAEWRDTDMARYLRPETLFGTKFEGYLNQGALTAKDGGRYAEYN